MQKLPLRPLRLQRLGAQEQLETDVVKETQPEDRGDVKALAAMQGERQKYYIMKTTADYPDHQKREKALKQIYFNQTNPTQPDTSIGENQQEAAGARTLLKRTPNNYVFNQIYGLWFYISSFLFTIVVIHNLNPASYGVYSIVLTALNTLLYIVALGIEDAVATFVPRTLAERGERAASQLARYLLLFRTSVLIISVVIILFGLPVLAALIGLIPLAGTHSLAASMNNPVLHEYSIPIALYVLGSGIGNLLSALCSAQMRSHIVLIASGFAQLLLLGAGFVLLRLGWGVTGILWMQAVVALLNAAVFIVWQAPFLRTALREYQPPTRDIVRLCFSAWITNLASGALLKQVSIIMLGVFAVSVIQIGYFNLSFQLADAANTLLVSGFLGVGGSALSAAFAGNNHDRLGKTWQALIKIETLLEAPALVFCLFNASNIVHALYGSKYDGVGSLLVIFLFFNLLVRLLGATIHQYGLYVVGKARLVVLSQWIGIGTVVVVGAITIPSWGAAGALAADGIAKAITGIFLLVFVLRDVPKHYAREVLLFTLRIVLALIIAALPWLLWHPTSRLLLGISGVAFIVLCILLLWIIKPLSKSDMEMLAILNGRLARYLRYFSRA